MIISTPKPLLALVRHLGGTDRLHSRRALRNGAELTKLAAGLQARRLVRIRVRVRVRVRVNQACRRAASAQDPASDCRPRPRPEDSCREM